MLTAYTNYGAGRMDLDGGVIHNEERLKGVGPEIETFLSPKKSRFQGPPFPTPREMDFPPSKSTNPYEIDSDL